MPTRGGHWCGRIAKENLSLFRLASSPEESRAQDRDQHLRSAVKAATTQIYDQGVGRSRLPVTLFPSTSRSKSCPNSRQCSFAMMSVYIGIYIYMYTVIQMGRVHI